MLLKNCSDLITKYLFSPIVILDINVVHQGSPIVEKDKIFDYHFSPIVQNLKFLDDRGWMIALFTIISNSNVSPDFYSFQANNNKNTSIKIKMTVGLFIQK